MHPEVQVAAHRFKFVQVKHIPSGLSCSPAAQLGCPHESAIQNLQHVQDDKILHIH